MERTRRIVYPESDGLPMAENTVQYNWISLLKWNIEVLFQSRDDVFVAGDNLIYPVEGNNKLRLAPDVYVAFGRPKADRGSYKVWVEGDIFPQVIVEVLSPSNRPAEMQDKLEFYERFGAREYYVLQPQGVMYLEGYRRIGDKLELIPQDDIVDFTSPLLGIHFIARDGTVAVYGPDGKRWDTPLGMVNQANHLAEKAELRAEEAAEMAQEANSRTALALDQLEAELKKAEAERQKAEAERQKAARYAEKLRALGLDPDAL